MIPQLSKDIAILKTAADGQKFFRIMSKNAKASLTRVWRFKGCKNLWKLLKWKNVSACSLLLGSDGGLWLLIPETNKTQNKLFKNSAYAKTESCLELQVVCWLIWQYVCKSVFVPKINDGDYSKRKKNLKCWNFFDDQSKRIRWTIERYNRRSVTRNHWDVCSAANGFIIKVCRCWKGVEKRKSRHCDGTARGCYISIIMNNKWTQFLQCLTK